MALHTCASMRGCAWQSWSAVKALSSPFREDPEGQGPGGSCVPEAGDMWVPHGPSQGRMAFRKDVKDREKWSAKSGKPQGRVLARSI